MCSDNLCRVDILEDKKTYYVTKDKDWNIVSFKDDKGIEVVEKDKPEKIKDKFSKLNQKKICENQGGYLKDNLCYHKVKKIMKYEDVIEYTQVEIMNEVNSTCKRLDKSLKVIIEDCVKYIPSGKYEQGEIQFKKGCDWNEDDNYYCIVEEEI